MAKIGLYLDTRTKNKRQLCSLKIVVRNSGQSAYHATGIELPELCWREGKVISGHDLTLTGQSALVLNRRIKNLYDRFELAFHDVAGIKTNMPARKILDRVVRQVRGETSQSPTILQLLEELSQNDDYSAGTRQLYRSVINTVERAYKKVLLAKPDELDRPMIDMLYKNLKQDGLKDITISTLMSKIAAAYNLALRRRLFVPEEQSPFFKQKWNKNYVPTRRNIPIQEFRSLWTKSLEPENFKTPKSFWSAKRSLMVFKLMFCLCGINVTDLYRLTDKDILNGRIETTRQKTGERISIKLEPEALELIRQLRQGSRLIGNAIEGRSRDCYRAFLIKQLQQIQPGLTPYYARHTWATLAFDLDVPDNVIAMGLSHAYKPSAMNAIYINNDYRKLDKANRRILDYVEGKIEID